MDMAGERCFNGKIRLREDNLNLPHRTKKPTVWAIWNDLFHEDVPNLFINRAWEEMSMYAKDHIFFVLTKRPERMKIFVENYERKWIEYAAKFDDCPTPEMRNSPAAKDARRRAKTPPTNIWLGVTAENQEQADKRIPILLQIPAARRYVSIEPMLSQVLIPHSALSTPHSIDWVICGGESGPGARPMHPDWARGLRDQCQAAGVPFFLKQHGEWSENYGGIPEKAKAQLVSHFEKGKSSCLKMWRVGKKAAGRMLDGVEHLEIPKMER